MLVWLWVVGWGGVWSLGGVVPWGRWGGAAAFGAFPGQLMLFVVSCVTVACCVCVCVWSRCARARSRQLACFASLSELSVTVCVSRVRADCLSSRVLGVCARLSVELAEFVEHVS